MNTKKISAITTKVCITPTSVGVAKYFIKSAAKGEPIIAPPPNPMMAMPAAMPRRSGHHLIGVDTGEISPRPSPIPPITPEPKTIIQNWCKYTPRAENNMPPHQHRADTTPTLRGPTRSSHPPQSEADDPSKTKNRMYIQPRVETFHSQVVVKSCAKRSCLSHASEFLIPSALDNGSQNTEKAMGHAYARVDGKGRRGDQPTVEARTCHDVFFVKKAGSFLGEGLLPHHARCHAVSWMQSTYKLGAVSLRSWW